MTLPLWRTISKIQLTSWPTYESYTGPLGAQTLTDILGSHLWPPVSNPRSAMVGDNGTVADDKGIGMDRTVRDWELASQGNIVRPLPRNTNLWNRPLTTCLLFFPPRSLHFCAALRKDRNPAHLRFPLRWRRPSSRPCSTMEYSQKATLMMRAYAEVLIAPRISSRTRPSFWRDGHPAIGFSSFSAPQAFQTRKDAQGNHPDRVEAEAMQLEGYTQVEVNAMGERLWR